MSNQKADNGVVAAAIENTGAVVVNADIQAAVAAEADAENVLSNGEYEAVDAGSAAANLMSNGDDEAAEENALSNGECEAVTPDPSPSPNMISSQYVGYLNWIRRYHFIESIRRSNYRKSPVRCPNCNHVLPANYIRRINRRRKHLCTAFNRFERAILQTRGTVRHLIRDLRNPVIDEVNGD